MRLGINQINCIIQWKSKMCGMIVKRPDKRIFYETAVVVLRDLLFNF